MDDDAGVDGEEGDVGVVLGAGDVDALASADLKEAKIYVRDDGVIDPAEDLVGSEGLVVRAIGSCVDWHSGPYIAARGLDVWLDGDDGELDPELDAARPVSAPGVPGLVEPRRSKPSETGPRGSTVALMPPPKPLSQ
jgi:hypothetical protein